MLLNQKEEMVKITFQVELLPPKKEPMFDYKELVTFLDNIEHIHENAIKFCYYENIVNSVDERLFLERFSLKLH